MRRTSWRAGVSLLLFLTWVAYLAIGPGTQSRWASAASVVIDSISPDSGAPGIVATLTGRNFNAARGVLVPTVSSPVRFGNAIATVLSWSETVIRVRVPRGYGLVPVSVQGVSSSIYFNYKTPRVSAIDPASGSVGKDQCQVATVTIRGQDFGIKQSMDALSIVKFGDSPVSSQDVLTWNDTLIQVRSPRDCGIGADKIEFLTNLFDLALTPGVPDDPAGTGEIAQILQEKRIHDVVVSATQHEIQAQIRVSTSAGVSNVMPFVYRVDPPPRMTTVVEGRLTAAHFIETGKFSGILLTDHAIQYAKVSSPDSLWAIVGGRAARDKIEQHILNHVRHFGLYDPATLKSVGRFVVDTVGLCPATEYPDNCTLDNRQDFAGFVVSYGTIQWTGKIPDFSKGTQYVRDAFRPRETLFKQTLAFHAASDGFCSVFSRLTNGQRGLFPYWLGRACGR